MEWLNRWTWIGSPVSKWFSLSKAVPYLEHRLPGLEKFLSKTEALISSLSLARSTMLDASSAVNILTTAASRNSMVMSPVILRQI
jgi:hypothetical protein